MKRLVIATTLAALAIAPAAMAKQPHGHHGHGKGAAANQILVDPATGQVFHSGAGVNANGVWTNPAGRAHPHGMPPGQSKKIAGRNGGLVVGNVLPTSYPGYQPISNYGAYNLTPAPAGYEYVRVGNDVYLRQSTSGVISNIIANLFR